MRLQTDQHAGGHEKRSRREVRIDRSIITTEFLDGETTHQHILSVWLLALLVASLSGITISKSTIIPKLIG